MVNHLVNPFCEKSQSSFGCAVPAEVNFVVVYVARPRSDEEGWNLGHKRAVMSITKITERNEEIVGTQAGGEIPNS